MSKQELREKWLMALESGEYVQIKRRMQKDGAFCALGLAEKICGNHNISGTQISLSAETQEKMGFRHVHGYPRDRKLSSVMVMNDFMGYSFAQIAKVVRENMDEYFED